MRRSPPPVSRMELLIRSLFFFFLRDLLGGSSVSCKGSSGSFQASCSGIFPSCSSRLKSLKLLKLSIQFDPVNKRWCKFFGNYFFTYCHFELRREISLADSETASAKRPPNDALRRRFCMAIHASINAVQERSLHFGRDDGYEKKPSAI